jgi:hypothetical protein
VARLPPREHARALGLLALQNWSRDPPGPGNPRLEGELTGIRGFGLLVEVMAFIEVADQPELLGLPPSEPRPAAKVPGLANTGNPANGEAQIPRSGLITYRERMP